MRVTGHADWRSQAVLIMDDKYWKYCCQFWETETRPRLILCIVLFYWVYGPRCVWSSWVQAKEFETLIRSRTLEVLNNFEWWLRRNFVPRSSNVLMTSTDHQRVIKNIIVWKLITLRWIIILNLSHGEDKFRGSCRAELAFPLKPVPSTPYITRTELDIQLIGS